MRDLYVRNVRLKELEPETARGENGGKGQVELTIRETVVDILDQWSEFCTVVEQWASKDGAHTSGQYMI